MSDLVDYLRDKLEHADDFACTCLDPDSAWALRCPEHSHQAWRLVMYLGARPVRPTDGGPMVVRR